jgi:GntR family transcriptional repressor for pyruvate dehydrogenase complex
MKRIERKRLSDQIIEQITSSIAKGKLKVGDKLPPEHVLMKQFGVGRSSLREAMGAMSLMGIISIKPGHGTQITASPDRPLANLLKWDVLKRQDKVQELTEARIILEQAAIELAIERAGEKDIAELKHILTEQELAKKNRKKYHQTDISFHLAVVKASHNDVLLRFVSEIRPSILTWMERSTPLRTAQINEISIKQHTAILEAIMAKDVKNAKLRIRQNIKYV